jgi:hypothetical protein
MAVKDNFDPWREIDQVVENGWPKEGGPIGFWLDQVIDSKWIDLIREAAAAPLGLVEDPRQVNGFVPSPVVMEVQKVARLVAARALQLQARGDHAAALDHLVWTLALSRNLRHGAREATAQVGRSVESLAFQGFDHWLDQLGPQPELLRRALQALSQHEAQVPTLADSIKAEYLVFRDRMDDPARWLIPESEHEHVAGFERELIAMSWQTAWEKERAIRLLNARFARRLQRANLLPSLETLGMGWNDMPGVERAEAALSPESWKQLRADSPLLAYLVPPTSPVRLTFEALSRCLVRGRRIKVALALHQVQEGRPAPTLDHLVPGYLAVLPVDPFSGASFHYRISAGDSIQCFRKKGEALETKEVAPGQGVVWSVGPDGVDNGGTKHSDQYQYPGNPLPFRNDFDVIFLVPSGPN